MMPLCPSSVFEITPFAGVGPWTKIASEPRPPSISVVQVGLVPEHEEPVVARAAVDDERLDVDEVDVEAGAEDAVRGDDEVVVELGADHDDGVEAVAAVDVAPAR